MINYTLPILGFCAPSGTGKTTLLRQLLPLLKRQGLRIGMIKHAHHSFDIDYPGKDSYELRKAGAEQMLIASRQRIALIMELQEAQSEPSLQESLALLKPDKLDLVLVEGFKWEAIPKIELHRSQLNTAPLYPHDQNIIAVASDIMLPSLPANITQLDINRPDALAAFILQTFLAEMTGLNTP